VRAVVGGGDRVQEVADEVILRRQVLGLDLFDEVWEGVYHMAPAPHGRHGSVEAKLMMLLGQRAQEQGLRVSGPCNIGEPNNYRVPDVTFSVADAPELNFHPTAEAVVEIVSPGDESRLKYDFYFRAGLKEVVIVDPQLRTVEWFARGPAGFVPAKGSDVLGVTAEEVRTGLGWVS
jgi:Uma2 family endonuclease